MPLYWRDVGTLEAYYASSMDLLKSDPPIDPDNSDWPSRSAYRTIRRSKSAFEGWTPS
jgi:glucose-1-phosphate adenylyltransferase